MSTLVYPHKLTFLNRGTCDVCGNKSIDLIRMNMSYYFGWETCGKDMCNTKIKSWYEETSIPKSELIEKYGDFIYVQRSNGMLEYNWVIDSDAIMESKDGYNWVQIKHSRRHLYKEVRLCDIIKWNFHE